VTVITLYSKPDCHLCVDARAVLSRVQADVSFELRELDITADETLHNAYFERIPVVAVDGEELFEYFVEENLLRDRLRAIL
jgi:glutaredoxin